MLEETPPAAPRWTLALPLLLILVGLIGAPLWIVSYLREQRQVPEEVELALRGADTFELLSLDGYERKPTAEEFHGIPVVGKVSIDDPTIRKELVDRFFFGVTENPGAVAACFHPRHGLRVTHQGRQLDLVICFECLAVKAYRGDDLIGTILISISPKQTFDLTLETLGVPRPAR